MIKDLVIGVLLVLTGVIILSLGLVAYNSDQNLKKAYEHECYSQPSDDPATAKAKKENCERINREKEPPETFSLFGWRSVKVSDAAIVLLTLLIAVFTGGLFWHEYKRAPKELRAYVGVTEVEVIEVPDRKVQGVKIQLARVSFKNTGQTPAHDLTSWICEDVFNKNNPAEDSFKRVGDEGKGGVLVPGVTWTRHVPIALNNLNWDNLEGESDAVWVWGGIDYTDSFGEPCTVSFRFWVGEKRERLDNMRKPQFWWPLIPHKAGNKATYGDKTKT